MSDEYRMTVDDNGNPTLMKRVFPPVVKQVEDMKAWVIRNYWDDETMLVFVGTAAEAHAKAATMGSDGYPASDYPCFANGPYDFTIAIKP